MHEILILQLLILLAMANGAPVIAKLILGDKFAAPVDGGALVADGRPCSAHPRPSAASSLPCSPPQAQPCCSASAGRLGPWLGW